MKLLTCQNRNSKEYIYYCLSLQCTENNIGLEDMMTIMTIIGKLSYVTYQHFIICKNCLRIINDNCYVKRYVYFIFSRTLSLVYLHINNSETTTRSLCISIFSNKIFCLPIYYKKVDFSLKKEVCFAI